MNAVPFPKQGSLARVAPTSCHLSLPAINKVDTKLDGVDIHENRRIGYY